MATNDIPPVQTDEQAPRRHRKPQDRMLRLRNVLNILFMLGAVVGVIYVMKIDRTTGLYIIFGAMALKFVESAIRLLKL